MDEKESDDPEYIAAYNRWAAGHEAILAKSLLSAGTTWAGVWLAEDVHALDVLCGRDDVDTARVGIGGLSGGGLRTVYLAGLDDRVRCAVCVGMMTTWRDFLLNKSHTHTWMIYVPHLPTEMDYPDILGMRVPLPTLVQNNTEDPLFTLAEMRRADVMLRQVYEKAGAAGGTVAMPAMDVMDSGRMIIIQDPTGAMVGLWQPKGHIGAQLVNMPNALVWNELQTKDVDAAMRFYGTVFGWGHDQDPNGYQMFKLGERMQAGMLKMDESWGEIPPHWGVYFMSEDIEATAAKAKELGGVIHVPPTSTGTVGRFSVIQDPQGGVFTAMQFDGPVDPPPGY